MKNLANSNVATVENSAVLAMNAIVPESNSLPNSARTPSFAPNVATGCVSEISSDAIHGCEHSYAAAMKSYGTIYEAYQAYLTPADVLAAHDYDLAAKPVLATNHLGCLDETFLEAATHPENVSDEDIEVCGYLGWLHH